MVTIKFTELRNCYSTSIQLSEVKFYHSGDIQVRPSGVSNPGGDFPENESPDMLIDNDVNTKWLDFGGKDCSMSTLVFTGFLERPESIMFVTANDEEGRDPISFEVKVCNRANVECNTNTFSNVDVKSDRLADYPLLKLGKYFHFYVYSVLNCDGEIQSYCI